MDISFITVTHNSENTIQACIKSALNQKLVKSEVIVVDNASSDNTVKVLHKIKNIKLIESNKNLGFSGGNNLGLAQAKGRILVFLNPDTILPSTFAKNMILSFAKHPEVAIVGCRILNPDGSLQRTGNTFPTMGSLLYENSGYHKIFKHSRAYNSYIIEGWDRRSSQYIDAVSGACFGCRKDFLDKVGGFDTQYFLFFEEFDLATAAKKLGFKVFFDSSLQITHIGGVSTKQAASNFIDKTYKQSQVYYIKKCKGQAFYISFKTLAHMFNILAKFTKS